MEQEQQQHHHHHLERGAAERTTSSTSSLSAAAVMPNNPWLRLQYEYCPADQWPINLRKKFWQSPLDYRDRLYFACHGFLNHISPDFMLEVLRFTNRNYNVQRAEQIRGVYRYLEGLPTTESYCRYYAYSFFEKRVLCLNGHIRGSPGCHDTYTTTH